MTYEQALAINQKWTPEQARNDLERLLLTNERPASKVLALAMQALERQIPKKVTHEATLMRCCTCPACGNVVDEFDKFGENTVRITYDYCHFCGQALDWGESK